MSVTYSGVRENRPDRVNDYGSLTLTEDLYDNL